MKGPSRPPMWRTGRDPPVRLMATTTLSRTARRLDFVDLVFLRVPLVCLAGIGMGGAVLGPTWTERLSPVPWLLSLVLVGLPHGANDYSLSCRAWRGRKLLAVCLAYAAIMACVVVAFAVAPHVTLATFVLLSAWHFGHEPVVVDQASRGGSPAVTARLSRGALVLAIPLVAWPSETALAANDLLAMVFGPHSTNVPSPSVRAVGWLLAAVAVLAILVEIVRAGRERVDHSRFIHFGLELLVIAGLAIATHPLFSVGCFFLGYHAWRQMESQSRMLTGTIPVSMSSLLSTIARIHVLAMPLLLPTWMAIGAAWWMLSSDHSAWDLAILSIGVYLVVTPAHEILGRCVSGLADAAAPEAGRRRKVPVPGDAHLSRGTVRLRASSPGSSGGRAQRVWTLVK